MSDETTDEPESNEELPEPEEGEPTEDDTFPRAYVERLRSEAADNRVKAKRTDEAMTRLTSYAIEANTAGILVDPSDLPVTDELYDEDGWPDPGAIDTAARALAEAKPHLADRRPTGTVDQGARDDEAPFSLGDTLRRLAG